ncbi:MAG TPA: glycosyltransferase [Bacteroidia bacterium]|nr:glycosyltransferase [Bacteroidia bacterium]
MSVPKRILVAPLDWGLGHATRCVPLIRCFREEGHEVILVCSGNAATFLRSEFPDLTFVEKKGYGIRYSLRIPMTLMMFLQAPKILYSIYREHQWLKIIQKQYLPDEVISDNCYGLWNKNMRSIFITHQLMIKCPSGLKWMEPLLHRVVRWFISRYDECWIPDLADNNNLSGDLSHKYSLPKNAKFIGSLSRFVFSKNDTTTKYDLCILLSGPEPQRTDLEKECLQALKTFKGKAILIQGKPGSKESSVENEKLRIISHLESDKLQSVLLQSERIICRSGYSTVMDLFELKKGALLIPTPGQTEQEYLAVYLNGKLGFEALRKNERISDWMKSIAVKTEQEKVYGEDPLISVY